MDSGFFGEYMPHGHCYAWHPLILWLSVLSDFVIAAAYFSIPIALVLIIKKRKDISFKGTFILSALFILFCGISHLTSIYTTWHGAYGIQAFVKFLTAVISIVSAVFIYLNMKRFLSIPSVEEHQQVLETITQDQIKLKALELERKAAAIFRFTTKFVPTGLLVIDTNQKILLSNASAETIFGYGEDELSGCDLELLLVSEMADRHRILVADFIKSGRRSHEMAAGRVVAGVKKDGSEVLVEIKIAVHDHDGDTFVLASITDVDREQFEQGVIFENTRRIRRALEASNDGVWEWNVETDDVWYSPRLMTMIGRGADEKPDFKYWESHIHPEDKDAVMTVLSSHLKRRERYDIIYRGLDGNNEYRWFHARGDTLFDQNGEPKLMSGTLADVHEVRELKTQLEQKSLFLKEVLDRSLTGLYIFNLKESKNIFINPEYTKICGYTFDDLEKIQKEEGDIFSLFHPDEREMIAGHFSEVLAQKENSGVGIEYRFKHKDGHWIWCYSRDSIFSFDENGEPLEMLGAFFDISIIKEREREVRELAINFSSTFEQAAVGMALVGLDGHFKKINKKLCDILGYSNEDLLAKHFKDITHTDDVGESNKLFEKMVSSESSHIDIEKRYICKSGKEIWAKTTVAMVRDAYEENSHFVTVIEDISARKKIEEELERSNLSLEHFAYSASHDLQEPLRKISAFSGLLVSRLEGTLEDPEAKFQLERISDAASRMGEMIRSLLDLSRYARQDLEKSKTTVSALLNIVLDDLSVRISKSGASITITHDAEVFVEPNSFQQVLRNLISNSIHYSDSGRPIDIKIQAVNNLTETVIEIVDNGIGFENHLCETIFEPFKRFNVNKSSGTGMGLSICRQIIQRHGGTIVACSVDVGATFTITLPREGCYGD